MSGYFYGIGGLGSSFFDTMLGNSQTGSTSSLSSSLGRSENDSEWCL